MKQYLPIVAVALALLWAFVSALPHLLFLKATSRVSELEREDRLAEAFAYAERLLNQVTSAPVTWFFRPSLTALFAQMARLADKRGDNDTAIAYLQRATAPGQDSTLRPFAMQYLAMTLRKQNRPEEATQIENEILTAQQKASADDAASNLPLVTGELTKIALLTSQGKLTQALALIDASEAAATHPELQSVLASQRSITLRYLGRLDEAIASYRMSDAPETEKEARRSSIATAYLGYDAPRVLQKTRQKIYMLQVLALAVLCLEADRVGSAQEHWEKLYGTTAPPDIYGLYTAVNAWLCAAVGDEEKAKQLLTEKHFADGSIGETRDYVVVRAYVALRDYRAAAEKLVALIAQTHHPLTKAEYESLLGDCYKKMERFEEAQSAYENVVRAGFEGAVFTTHARTQLHLLRATTE